MNRGSDMPLDRFMSGFLTEHSGLYGDERETFARVVAALMAALRTGSIRIELTDSERAVLAASRMVSGSGEVPLVLCGPHLYVARYYHYELRLAERLKQLAGEDREPEGVEALLTRCFGPAPVQSDQQREAARVALCKSLCVITGGPGTGKTTTVVKIVGLLLACYGVAMKIVLAAPTGKAAMRLRESIAQSIPDLSFSAEIKAAFPQDATTLHRLLGARRFSPHFHHNRDNPLNWDVVLVDEASMVDLALMSKLVEALKKGSRLILLGDKDQLASVESGAVLADCLEALADNVVELYTSYRFDTVISEWAGAINSGDVTMWERLETNEQSSVVAAGPDWLEQAGTRYESYMRMVAGAAGPADYPRIFRRFNGFRILCALKRGQRGVSGVNARIERYLGDKGFSCGQEQWYPGRPVIVTRNDYQLGLYNGDVGICLPDPESPGGLSVWFEQQDKKFQRVLPVRLSACETVWAMTVHKSQGSEFAEVLLVLPEQDNQVLCRELLYTAVTRARTRVMILADKEVWRAAVTRRTIRHSGLAQHLRP